MSQSSVYKQSNVIVLPDLTAFPTNDVWFWIPTQLQTSVFIKKYTLMKFGKIRDE